MLSHIIYADIDRVWPASLSDKIAKKLLREKIGYDGVTITDDLNMGAIKKRYDIKTVISRIIESDIDIALICRQGTETDRAFHEMLKSARKSPSGRSMHTESVKRIMRLKAGLAKPQKKQIEKSL